jgi:hypothetical protein
MADNSAVRGCTSKLLTGRVMRILQLIAALSQLYRIDILRKYHGPSLFVSFLSDVTLLQFPV